MSLLDFFESEHDYVCEDATLVHVSRPYKEGDLNQLLTLYEECELHHVSVDVILGIVDGNSIVPLLYNFEVKETGIAALLKGVEESNRVFVESLLAAARSAHGGARAVAAQIDKILKGHYNLSWFISVTMRKYTLERYFRSQGTNAGVSYYFWIRCDLFKTYVEHNLQSFLNTLWNGDYPIIVLMDSPKVCNLKFCVIAPEPPSSLALDTAKHSLLKRLICKILAHDVSIPFVLALTFHSEDAKCSAVIKSFVPDYRLDRQLLRLDESQFIDWKKQLNTGSLAEDAAAFANACGGLLIYGIDNSGRVVGCGNVTRDEISNALQGVRPSLKWELQDVVSDGNRLLGLLVWPPDGDTVYLVSKGRRPFRYMSSTCYFDYDDEVLKARHTLCQ